MSAKPVQPWQRWKATWHRRIWQNSHRDEPLPARWTLAFLRVCSISFTVFVETAAASRAAALSFSSLLGLGPLVAIAVLIAGFVLGKSEDPNLVANNLNRVLHFVAPQIATYEKLAPAAATAGQPAAANLNPQVVDLLNSFITGAQSGSAAGLGVVSLILIVLLLFKSIEDAFNDIWGVRNGRSLMVRIVYYWTILTLGAVLFFTALTLLGATAVVNTTMFAERLPFGTELLGLLRWSLPVISFLMLVGILTLFYRVIPNTRVYWRAAFAGAVVVTALLLLNNFVALFYVRRVILTKSLYGSLGLPLVIMLGLFVFWLYILIGGIISYAVQNFHFRSSQAAWGSLSESMRERLSLIVLLTICRRFQACLPPVTASHLGTMIRVPTQILNASLGRLVDLGLLSPLTPPEHGSSTDYLYQPARPLNKITLADFKTLFERQGEDPTTEAIDSLDPLVVKYQERLRMLTGRDAELLQKPLDELFGEIPFDETAPPFSRLDAR
jgi:membrane protein